MKARAVCWLLIFAVAYVLGGLHHFYGLAGLSIIAIWFLGRTWQLPKGAMVMLRKLWREGHYGAAVRFWLYLAWLGIEGHLFQMRQYRLACRELPMAKKVLLL